MADFTREGVRSLVNDFIDDRLESQFVQLHPILHFMSARDSKESPYGRLGHPGMGSVFGGATMDKAERETRLGSLNRMFNVVKYESEDMEGVEHGGETATASGFAGENMGSYEMRWSHLNKGLRLNKHELEQAAQPGGRTAEAAITQYTKKVCREPFERFLKGAHERFWTGTLTETEQNGLTWKNLLGIQHALTDNNVYGRVNRANVDGMTPNVLDATADFASPVPDLTMIRNINSGFNRYTAGTEFLGLKARSHGGAGAQCIITTPALWQELADQIDARYHIDVSQTPEHGLGGFTSDLIYYQGTYITWDQLCPAGEMYLLNLDTWLLEVKPNMNMQLGKLTDKDESEEGGGYYLHGRFNWAPRFSCMAFWANARVTGLQTAA